MGYFNIAKTPLEKVGISRYFEKVMWATFLSLYVYLLYIVCDLLDPG